jgi:hypothetical protein|tara:strand:+ start:1855 stop:2169 length:315 start_codon:yes stop_codon:yes gene_type:complete
MTVKVGIDGYNRSPEQDEKISADMGALFASPSGASVLRYLRSITIETVAGPDISNEKLRHLEGQRYIIGLIERRIVHNHGVKNGRTSNQPRNNKRTTTGKPDKT